MEPLSLASTRTLSPNLLSTSVRDRANALQSSSSSSAAGASSSANTGLGLGLPSTGGGGGAIPSRPAVQSSELDDVRITSPQELTQFVDNLLTDLESRFDAMSTDVLSRLSSLSTRVDSLEASIGDLMSGTAGGPVPGDPDGPPLDSSDPPLRSSAGSTTSKS
ncbi:hypothetical protein RQP46_010013 [Phenoliferia psychrophenolica]